MKRGLNAVVSGEQLCV